MSALSKLFQCLFYLVGDAFASRLYAIVGETASVALDDEDVQLVFGVLLSKGGTEVL